MNMCALISRAKSFVHFLRVIDKLQSSVVVGYTPGSYDLDGRGIYCITAEGICLNYTTV